MIKYDVAKILRRNYFNIEQAALVIWRLGISTLDIALASCLSTPQRLDLIGAVDQLVNRPNLGNRKETIMSPDNDNLDPDLAHLNSDYPEADEFSSGEDEEKDVDSQLALEDAIADNEDELKKALTDPPDTEAMEDQARQADLDQCCGTDPTLGQEKTGKDVFKPIFQEGQDKVKLDVIVLDAQSDRERVTQLPKHPDQTIPGNRSPAREEVYKLLDGEREYQGIKCANHSIDDSKWSPNDWLVFIEQYLYDAREMTGNPGLQMDEIRKIGGLVVAAMENIPTPSRV